MTMAIEVFRRTLAALVALLSMGAAAQIPPPTADHHQHVFSPQLSALIASPTFRPIDAAEVIGLLDAAGIRKAVLLSSGYIFSAANRNVPDDYARVREENDWVAAQAALYPDRLRAFCGLNPLKDYALDEIARCARHPGLRHGIKLHMGSSDVQLENPSHLDRLRRVFKAANDHGMAIVIHLRASISLKRAYGVEQARAFVDKVLAAAPNVPVQVAHLGGTGPGFEDPPSHVVLEYLATCMERRDRRVNNLWLDVASIVHPSTPQSTLDLIARRIRQIGLDRVVYGTDSAAGDNLRPRESWTAFQRLPLRDEEFARIARNVAPYLR